MENPAFIHAVAATGKPVLLSTGGSGLGVVEASIDVVRSEGNENLMLLHGVQNFPTKTADSHLRYIETLKRLFGLPVGFLDHVDGGSEMAAVLPALAVAFGADLVEKHMTLDRAAKGFDYQSALEEDGFRKMVALIREAETAFGEPGLVESEGASRYHGSMRRAVMSAVALPQGEPIAEEQLVFLRNEKGLSPSDAQRIVGRKPRRDIAAFEPLTEDLF
jgi:sialic acid synthase SpsE